MFNLFDEDGNGNINVEELLNMMAFFIEIGITNIYLMFCYTTFRRGRWISGHGHGDG